MCSWICRKRCGAVLTENAKSATVFQNSNLQNIVENPTLPIIKMVQFHKIKSNKRNKRKGIQKTSKRIRKESKYTINRVLRWSWCRIEWLFTECKLDSLWTTSLYITGLESRQSRLGRNDSTSWSSRNVDVPISLYTNRIITTFSFLRNQGRRGPAELSMRHTKAEIDVLVLHSIRTSLLGNAARSIR